MRFFTKKMVMALIVAGFAVSACTGGSELEGKLVTAFKEINAGWELYEVKKTGNTTVIMVEAEDVVPFKEAKKALAEVLKIDPKMEGFIEFYNSEVGMTLRKIEIIPAI